MLLDTEPVFIADRYTDCGKWMDGWETRRKRIAGHDWCIVRLGAAGRVRGLTVDTAHFTGNYAPRISVQGVRLSAAEQQLLPARRSQLGGACTADEAHRAGDAVCSDRWPELVPMTRLLPGYEATRRNHIAVDETLANSSVICTHLRINIYPDGGIARLRVYGDVHGDVDALPVGRPIDLLAMQNGAACVAYSNAHYGHPRNLLRPGRAAGMADGWETMRRLDRPAVLCTDPGSGLLQVVGSEWAVLRMCAPLGELQSLVVDTLHFKGNYPDAVTVEVARLGAGDTLQSAEWRTLLPTQKLQPNREHVWRVGGTGGEALRNDVATASGWNYVRVTMAPDGGISRVRLVGLRAVE